MSEITILIPVYNESKTILLILERIRQNRVYLPSSKIIVIDDGSNDGTFEILESNKHLYDTLIRNSKNKGKGFALKVGLLEVKSEYVLIQDADLEYDPFEIPRLWGYIKNNNIDLLMTTRLSGSSLNRIHYYWHKVGNKFITTFFNIFNNTTYSDIYSGYLIFRYKNLKSRKLIFNGWGQQAEILTFLTTYSSRIFEAPIAYYGRTYDEGKKIRFTAVFKVLTAILFTKLRSLFYKN